MVRTWFVIVQLWGSILTHKKFEDPENDKKKNWRFLNFKILKWKNLQNSQEQSTSVKMTRRKLKTPILFLKKRQKIPYSSQNEFQKPHPHPRKIKWRPLKWQEKNWKLENFLKEIESWGCSQNQNQRSPNFRPKNKLKPKLPKVE